MHMSSEEERVIEKRQEFRMGNMLKYSEETIKGYSRAVVYEKQRRDVSQVVQYRNTVKIRCT